MPNPTPKGTPLPAMWTSSDERRLAVQAGEALARRSPAAVLGYVAVSVVVLWATSLFQTHPVFSSAALFWSIVLGGLRWAVARALPRIAPHHIARWRFAFASTAIAAAVSWGLAASAATFELGLGPKTMVVLVTLAGASAGSLTSLGPSLWLSRAYVITMITPSICVMAGHVGTSRASLGMAVLLSIWLGYLLLAGRQGHTAFVEDGKGAILLERGAQEVGERARSMKLVLDNVGQGFLDVALDGSMSPERSAILDHWLGPSAPGDTLWAYVARTDPKLASWIRLGWDSIADDLVPIELVLEQLPRRLVSGDRILALEYRPILVDESMARMLVIVTDITNEVERERSSSDKEEILAAFEQITRDRAGFREFLLESEGLLAELGAGVSASRMLRALHTLKGNCASFGLRRLSRICHDLESLHAQTGEPLTPADTDTLRACWQSSMGGFRSLLGSMDDRIEITRAEHSALAGALARDTPRHELAGMLDEWLREPTSMRLERIAEQLTPIATRLGKGAVLVSTESNGLRLPADRWAGFWSAFGHVVRNAIFHGIEVPEERRQKGKSAEGHLAIRTQFVGSELVISLEDDGRGIDWAEVRSRATARNLPTATHRDLVAALFVEGVTTLDSPSEDAGRGVGMSAFLAATESMGGYVELWTEPGLGTRWSAHFPRARATAVTSTAMPLSTGVVETSMSGYLATSAHQFEA